MEIRGKCFLGGGLANAQPLGQNGLWRNPKRPVCMQQRERKGKVVGETGTRQGAVAQGRRGHQRGLDLTDARETHPRFSGRGR